jgi:hypothetical protein
VSLFDITLELSGAQITYKGIVTLLKQFYWFDLDGLLFDWSFICGSCMMVK